MLCIPSAFIASRVVVRVYLLPLLLAQVSKPELCHMTFGPLCVNLCVVWVMAIAALGPALVGSARLAKLRWDSGSSARWGTSTVACEGIIARVLSYYYAFQQVI